VPVADQIWFAVIGPDTASVGEIKTEEQLYQNQLAKTLSTLLGLNYTNEPKPGDVVSSVIGK